MAIMYRHGVNVLERLKEKGFSTYRLRKEGLFSESTIQHFREMEKDPFARGVRECKSIQEMDKLCRLLNCDIGDLYMHI